MGGVRGGAAPSYRPARWANDLAKHSIRVNTIHPAGVATGMVINEAMQSLLAESDGSLEQMQNALPIPVLMPEDITNAVAFLVSDEAKFITGTAWPLDAGFAVRASRGPDRCG